MAWFSTLLQNRRGREYTLVELACTGAVLAAVLAVFLDQLTFYQEQAEKSAVQSTVALLQNALAMRAMVVLVKAGPEQMGKLEQENPMDWLAETPRNYAGSFFGEPFERIKGGGWYFDRDTRTLVYQVWRTRHFESPYEGRAEIRFRVTAEYGDMQAGAAMPRGLRKLHVGPQKPYRWLDD